jgi:hypothetical protein
MLNWNSSHSHTSATSQLSVSPLLFKNNIPIKTLAAFQQWLLLSNGCFSAMVASQQWLLLSNGCFSAMVASHQ